MLWSLLGSSFVDGGDKLAAIKRQIQQNNEQKKQNRERQGRVDVENERVNEERLTNLEQLNQEERQAIMDAKKQFQQNKKKQKEDAIQEILDQITALTARINEAKDKAGTDLEEFKQQAERILTDQFNTLADELTTHKTASEEVIEEINKLIAELQRNDKIQVPFPLSPTTEKTLISMISHMIAASHDEGEITTALNMFIRKLETEHTANMQELVSTLPEDIGNQLTNLLKDEFNAVLTKTEDTKNILIEQINAIQATKETTIAEVDTSTTGTETDQAINTAIKALLKKLTDFSALKEVRQFAYDKAHRRYQQNLHALFK